MTHQLNFDFFLPPDLNTSDPVSNLLLPVLSGTTSSLNKSSLGSIYSSNPKFLCERVLFPLAVTLSGIWFTTYL